MRSLPRCLCALLLLLCARGYAPGAEPFPANPLPAGLGGPVVSAPAPAPAWAPGEPIAAPAPPALYSTAPVYKLLHSCLYLAQCLRPRKSSLQKQSLRMPVVDR